MNNADHSLHDVAAWLLREIGSETTERLASHSTPLVCPDCLAHCVPHEMQIRFFEAITYYGCRTCGQSRDFLKDEVVAVLDDQMTVERLSTERSLRVNWLARRQLFDFERVEIIQATDEAVERLVVQIGNDTDPVRQPRYQEMRCLISADCQLSENTRRILGRTFGKVTSIGVEGQE